MGSSCSMARMTGTVNVATSAEPSQATPEGTATTAYARGSKLQKLVKIEKADYDYDTRPDEPTAASSSTKTGETAAYRKPAAKQEPKPTTSVESSQESVVTSSKDDLTFKAAFLGNDFAYVFLLVEWGEYVEVSDLATLCNLPIAELRKRLKEPLKSGLVQKVDNEGSVSSGGSSDLNLSEKQSRMKVKGKGKPLGLHGVGPDEEITTVMLTESGHEKLLESAPKKFQLPKSSKPCDIRFRILSLVARNTVEGDFDDINVSLRLLHNLTELNKIGLVNIIVLVFESGFFKRFHGSSTVIPLKNRDSSTWKSHSTLLTTVCENQLDQNLVELVYQFWPDAVKIKDASGNLPLHWSVRGDKLALVEFVYEKYPEGIKILNRNKETPILNAIKTEANKAIVEFLAEKWPEGVKIANEDGEMTLHFAAEYGMLSTVEMLYRICPDAVKAPNKDGETPLHFAAHSQENIKVIKFLTDKWPDGVKFANEDGCYPLRWAAEYGDLETVRFLYEQWPDAALKADKSNGMTPLAAACDMGAHEIALFLAEKSPETCTQPNANKYTPLHLLFNSSEPSVALTKFFLEKYPECISMKSRDNCTPLHLIIQNTQDESPGRERKDPNESSGFPSHKFAFVKEMVEKFPDTVSIVNDDGFTPLALAFENDNQKIFRYLAEKFPQVLKIPDYEGNTILHVIAEGDEEDWALATFITEKCPETVAVRNEDGETPLDVADRLGHSKFRDRLSKKV